MHVSFKIRKLICISGITGSITVEKNLDACTIPDNLQLVVCTASVQNLIKTHHAYGFPQNV